MKFFGVVLFFLVAQAGATAANLERALVGTWQSDEARTMADMHKHAEIPEKSRAFLENGFFGRLIVVFQKGKSAAYFTDDDDRSLKFLRYKVISEGEDYLVLRQYNPVAGVMENQKWFFEDGCIYTYITKWQFREYFCKVTQ